MRAHIYQMDLTPENIRLCFAPYEYVLKECCGQIPSVRYARVYSLEVGAEDPEALYALLNLHHPSDYTARSLSVSDVIELHCSCTNTMTRIYPTTQTRGVVHRCLSA